MQKNISNGMVQVFYGNGKGKTSAALGIAIRACGNGFKVHLVQFLKNGASSLEQQIPCEIISLKKFKNFSYRRFGIGEWYIKGKNEEKHKEIIEKAMNHLFYSFKKNYNVIIADEILYAVQLNLLDESEVIRLIQSKPKNKELILTGSHIPFPKIFELADLVTEVKKIKHPYDKGIIARRGIDY